MDVTRPVFVNPNDPEVRSLMEEAERTIRRVDNVIAMPLPGEQPNEASKFARNPVKWSKLHGQEPPARRWATKGWFGFGHITLTVGQGGIGKTLLAQQWASCLALGREFIDEGGEPLRVLMWACEDDHDELWRRQISVAEWLGVGLDDFEGRLIIEPRHGLDNTLIASIYGTPVVTSLITELRDQAEDYKADVVILDNVGQLYGAGENDRHAVTVFMNGLAGALGKRAVMLLAHPSRGQGSEFSGSSAWENVARTRLYLGDKMPDAPKAADDDPINPEERFLARRKANYSSKDWRRFNYQNGVLVPDESAPSGGIIDQIRARNSSKIVLSAMRALVEKNILPTDGAPSPRYLPKLIIQYKLDEGCTKRELAQAMRKAIMDGHIERGVVGRHSSNRTPKEGLLIVEKDSHA